MIKMPWTRDLPLCHQRILPSSGYMHWNERDQPVVQFHAVSQGAQLRLTSHSIRLTGGSHPGPFGQNRALGRDLEVFSGLSAATSA